MREAFRGRRRFDAFYEALSMSRGVRENRLTRLLEAGLLTKRLYQDRPPRYEYVLPEKGRNLYPMLAAMWRFGEDWLWPEGSETPLQLFASESGDPVEPRVDDERSGRSIDVRKIRVGLRQEG
jgi:DNA-binding HxlR family transcriptional regulator